jgi:hypothetical protein
MFQTLVNHSTSCKTAMNFSVQGCFVDVQVFFPITTFPTLSNASKAALTFVRQSSRKEWNR